MRMPYPYKIALYLVSALLCFELSSFFYCSFSMRNSAQVLAGFLISASNIRADITNVATDINIISRNWGHLSPYQDNLDNSFGVEYAGLPEGCQIESAHTLQRHAERFPTEWINDGENNQRFGDKVTSFTTTHPDNLFTGPLKFLNSWSLVFPDQGLLTGTGAVAEVAAGVKFWNQYGRTLYNASFGQLAYNSSFPDGTQRPPLVLRTTDQSRMQNTQINWALGFFGSSISPTPNPSFENATQPYEVVILSEKSGTKLNNTLASYVSCLNSDRPAVTSIADNLYFDYLPKYLASATERLQYFAPEGFKITINDTYAMQMICAYEHAVLGASEFCGFFTEDEWAGFENSLDIDYYYNYAFGNPTGRAQGIGYVEELLARLNHSLITSSSNSINSTLDSDPRTFPTDQAVYADFTHDDIIISVLTALSVDYFHAPPNFTLTTPEPDRKFILSKITPFAGRLITETIGCSEPNPIPQKNARVYYSPNQYGYNASTAKHKFVRMRLNNGIIPLNTIRGGFCGNEASGRTDGLCALEDFIKSQENASAMANYQYACFANYTTDDRARGWDWDGTIQTEETTSVK
ncbi:unnamed protein product [Blumeria hordei]|uniref:Uncharacterized protein n=1 Tax=Blumeria hordei TaxID=2867405 RepID=A0A383UJU7_BLUHO|nr:unnamed protein product [Blumeria hordei]